MNMNEYFPVIIASFIILIVLVKITIKSFFIQDTFFHLLVSERKKNQQHLFLDKHFAFYSKLDRAEKTVFLKRINYFMHVKKFEGRQGFIITPEVKMLVSCSAIQITFGLKNYILHRFPTIFIYPDIYLNKITGNYHKGEVNEKGLIVLSWKYFLQGYHDDSDKINLGLHEMAHALSLTIIRTNDHDQGLDERLSSMIHLSEKEIRHIRASNFFRNYASKNIYEFFSVAVEYFFEAPVEFNEKIPSLYSYMCSLLNQNPAKGLHRSSKLKTSY